LITLKVNTRKVFEMAVREVLFYEFDDFRLDVKRQELVKDGYPVSLTHKAFQILLLLVQNFGQTVEKETIYQELWGDSFVEDANLTQHIYVLRKTLGPDPDGELYIETVARSGYRFTSEVRAVHISPVPMPDSPVRNYLDDQQSITNTRPHLMLLRNDAAGAQDEAILPPGEPSEAPNQPVRPASKYRKSLFALALTAVITAAIAGMLYFVSRPPVSPPGARQIKSIAILPFKPIGEDTWNQKLGLGMADAVITRLGKVREIPVRPVNAVFRYTDNPAENSAVAGHEMGVDTVLEGTVQRDDERIRVTVRLINVSDGQMIWAESFDENAANLFAVQDSISSKVVKALEITLTPQQELSLAEHSTSSQEAYLAFQLGVYFGGVRTKAGLQKAVEYFKKATEADPKYARLFANPAETHNLLG